MTFPNHTPASSSKHLLPGADDVLVSIHHWLFRDYPGTVHTLENPALAEKQYAIVTMCMLQAVTEIHL